MTSTSPPEPVWIHCTVIDGIPYPVTRFKGNPCAKYTRQYIILWVLCVWFILEM